MHPRARSNIERFGLAPLLNGANIALLPPQGYLEMLGFLAGATLVLTDSGGIQEETTALDVPCLTMRDNTERPITVEQGTNTLVGRNRSQALACVDEILRTGGKRGRIPELWDGHAAERIADELSCVARAFHRPASHGPGMSPRDATNGAIVNALTIDVEDYFQVSAFAAHIPRASWDSLPCRVERNIDHILLLLADADVRATFFTLGWIAERYPEMIRRIVDGGHELASHGYEHFRATEQGYGQFLADIRLAKAVLEDISGGQVKGYRAPSFSVGPGITWAFECIAEAGYRYSSSVYPDPPRSLWRARRSAFRARSVQGSARVADHDGTNAPLELARRRRRLFPAAALWGVALVDPARQCDRSAAGAVLLPSVGARSGPAARQGSRSESAIPALPQPRAHGSRACAAC